MNGMIHFLIQWFFLKLTIPHSTKEMPEGKKPAVIDLRPQATTQEVSTTPGALAFSVVWRSDTRLRRRQKIR
jgi:hypothetical protein